MDVTTSTALYASMNNILENDIGRETTELCLDISTRHQIMTQYNHQHIKA